MSSSAFQRAEEGLRLADVDRTPAALPNNKGWIYYQVTRQNAAWREKRMPSVCVSCTSSARGCVEAIRLTPRGGKTKADNSLKNNDFR